MIAYAVPQEMKKNLLDMIGDDVDGSKANRVGAMGGMCVCMYIRMFVGICMYIHIRKYVCMYVCMYVCIYLSICVYEKLSICMYV